MNRLCGSGLQAPPCPADCNTDRALDTRDFVCYMNAFASGDPAADCDASGVLAINDFVCFQSGFAAGCP